MTAIEIVLIIVGIVFMIASFFVTEKLSQHDIAQISELSSVEMKRILEKNLEGAENKVKTMVETVVGKSAQVIERALQKETNHKIQNISEYSDTVLESIHKNHEEVVFLYSMLNDKQNELTKFSESLGKLESELQKMEEDVTKRLSESRVIVEKMAEKPAEVQVPMVEKTVVEEVEEELQELLGSSEEELMNRNQEILDLHRKGFDMIEIARQLGMGVGEVKLVLGLYREEEL